MDWKPWYRAEAESDRGRAAVESAVTAHRDGDADVRRALSRGGAVSFPHTTLSDSADPLACVATSVLAEGFERVLALGVLHGSSLPEPQRVLLPAAARGEEAALASVGGAFVEEGDASTPWGAVPAGPSPGVGPWVRPGGALLEREFSLDLFLAVLAAAARARGRIPPGVTRVFVGPTRTERGPTSAVEAVAGALRPLLGPRVALVATGDLVHAGHGYGPEEETAALPRDPEALRRLFEPRVRAMLEGSFAGGEAAEAADAAARALRSDQRHAAPVLAACLGAGARARLLSFRLTDYGPILSRPPPCVVATALATMEPAARIPEPAARIPPGA